MKVHAIRSIIHISCEVFFFRWSYVTNFSWTPNPIFALIKGEDKSILEKKRISRRERVSWTDAVCTVSCEGPLRVSVWRFFQIPASRSAWTIGWSKHDNGQKVFLSTVRCVFARDTPKDESTRGTEDPWKVIDGIFPSRQHSIVQRTRRFY